MNKLLTFEILLYLNMYYFGLYFGMEFLFLFLKFLLVESSQSFEFWNDLFLLVILGVIESGRLYISQVCIYKYAFQAFMTILVCIFSFFL